MNTRIAWILTLAVVGLLCACGSQSSHPMAGTYVLDVERTVAAATVLKGTNAAGSEAAAARMREQFGPEAYRLELHHDRTFAFVLGEGDASFVLSGTWGDAEEGLELRTTAIDGVPPEGGTEEGLVEIMRSEGEDRLILTQADREIVLVRQ